MRVGLFITCFNDTLYPQVGIATVHLLERLGVGVDFPMDQTCCGQIHVNTGYARDAITLVRHFVDVFSPYELVIAPSASCVGLVREQYPRLALQSGDTALQTAVSDLLPRVVELTEFLVDHLGIEDVGARYPHRVAYHPTCHSMRVLQIGERPLRLLRAVQEIELVEIPDALSCCGFGGTFSVKNAPTSIAMLEDKIQAVQSTQAEVLCSADTSCLMHIGGGLHRQRSPIQVRHLVEILAGGIQV
jgi:L-lactate dehydrogenase complex protein LldE